jgi:hypothetical protein
VAVKGRLASLKMRAGWILATDFEAQWILHRRQGNEWNAITFPRRSQILLAARRCYVGDPPERLAVSTLPPWQATRAGQPNRC